MSLTDATGNHYPPLHDWWESGTYSISGRNHW